MTLTVVVEEVGAFDVVVVIVVVCVVVAGVGIGGSVMLASAAGVAAVVAETFGLMVGDGGVPSGLRKGSGGVDVVVGGGGVGGNVTSDGFAFPRPPAFISSCARLRAASSTLLFAGDEYDGFC